MENEKKEATKDFNSAGLFWFLMKWKKELLIIAIVAIIVSSVVSIFIKNKYKSTVILFPSSTSSVSKALLSEGNGAKQDILQFGEEEETEQLLQVLQSDDIRDAVIKNFNLLQHYDIDTASKYKYSDLFDMYDANISFKRTEFMSVKIEVLDTDPKMAADIANRISELYDSTQNKIQKQRSIKGLKLVEGKYLDFKAEMQSDEDSLNKLRAIGINDYESQSEKFYEAYAKALLENKPKVLDIINERIAILAKYGGAYVSIRDNFEHKRKQLSFLKAKYEEAKMDAEQDLPHKFVVNYGHIPEKKSYPIRWLIVLVSTLCSLFVGVLALILIENYKNLNRSNDE